MFQNGKFYSADFNFNPITLHQTLLLHLRIFIIYNFSKKKLSFLNFIFRMQNLMIPKNTYQ